MGPKAVVGNVMKEDDDENEFQDTDFDSDVRGKVQDLIKNAVVGGLSAVFMTEDTIRSFIKEKKIPKEWTHDLLNLAGKRKDDFLGLIGKEVANFFRHVDIQKELSTFFKNHDLKLKAEISFVEKKKNGSNDNG